MGQQISKREQRLVEEARQVMIGTAGMVQCEGCPAGVLAPEADGLCERHLNESFSTIRYES